MGNFGCGAASLTTLCQSHKRTILASVAPAIGKGITQDLRRAVRHCGAPLLTASTARPAVHPVRRISAETKTCAVVRPRNKLEIDGRHEPVPSQERAHWTIQRRSFVYKQSRVTVISLVGDQPLRFLPWAAVVVAVGYADRGEGDFGEFDFRRSGRSQVLSQRKKQSSC